MYKLEQLFSVLDEYAPIILSKKMIEQGEYDNSGILVKSSDSAEKILFCLDLTDQAVEKARRLKCDTIVTHHPAIYTPIKSLSVDDSGTGSVLKAIKYGLNVISMHLNLDVADEGIDAMLCKGIGGVKYKILNYVDDSHGYGREFPLNGLKLFEIKNNIKKEFKTNKVLTYGNKNSVIKKCASFCGGGASIALDTVKANKTDANLIITSDMPHHVIKELTESGKCIILLTHFISEEYGFNKFYASIADKIKGKAEAYYFVDKRFK